MSLIKAIKAQLGLSVTPANNFTLDASADNGTMKLVKGASTNVMEVAADGKVTFPQNAITYSCKAWVKFDGTRNVTDSGASTNGQPVKIYASSNVTSVTKNATGDFTVNFATAMADANYVMTGTASQTNAQATGRFLNVDETNAPTTSACRVLTSTITAKVDQSIVSVAIFGN